MSSVKAITPEAIGKRLRGLLEGEFGGHPMSQNALGRRLAISQSFISQVVRGTSLPSLALAVGVGDTFGVAIEWFLTGHGSPRPGRSMVEDGEPMLVMDQSPAPYVAGVNPSAVYVDGRALPLEEAEVHRAVQVALDAGEPHRGYVMDLAESAARRVGAVRDPPRAKGRSASGVG